MATQQEILSWLAANPQATDRDIAAAMNQYGVSTGDLAGATGWDAGAVNDRYGVANAQNYIDTQWSGDGSIPGWGSAFTPAGTFDAGNTQRNYGVLGALEGMGLTRDQQARVTGLDAGAIDSFAQQYAPQVGIYKDIYQSDLANPAPYMQPIQPTTTGLPGLPGPQAAPAASVQPSKGPPQAFLPGLRGAPFPPTGGYQTSPGQAGGYAMPDGSGDQGMFGSMYGGYQASPWLSATADEIGRRTQQALGQAFNGIRSNAVGVGGLGGSRQGVAESQATSNAIDSLQGNLANMFAQDWTGAQNRGLQARGQDQNFTVGIGGLANQRAGMNMNYDLGLGQQALTERGQDMGFYNANRDMDLQQLGLGANIFDMGVRGGWAPLTTAGGLFNQTAKENYTNTTGSTQGGGATGLLGGLWGGAKFGKDMGWF